VDVGRLAAIQRHEEESIPAYSEDRRHAFPILPPGVEVSTKSSWAPCAHHRPRTRSRATVCHIHTARIRPSAGRAQSQPAQRSLTVASPLRPCLGSKARRSANAVPGSSGGCRTHPSTGEHEPKPHRPCAARLDRRRAMGMEGREPVRDP
jgi:hypothetical protein